MELWIFAIAIVLLMFVIYKQKEAAEELKHRVGDLEKRLNAFLEHETGDAFVRVADKIK